MLGVAVDYPILLTTLRRPDEDLPKAAARTWPTLRLAAAAAVAGPRRHGRLRLPGPGATRPLRRRRAGGGGADDAMGPAAAGGADADRDRGPCPSPCPARCSPSPATAAAPSARWRPPRSLLAALGGPRWQRDLAALSPVPPAAQALDAELRRQLGAPDVRFLVAIGPADQAAVLRAAERLRDAVAPLIASGALAGLDEPSRYLPSPDTQRARQAALPEPAALEERMREAATGLPFRPTAFAPFLAAVAESRALPPLDAEALAAAPTIAARLSPLLSRRGEAWQGLAVATGVVDPDALPSRRRLLARPVGPVPGHQDGNREPCSTPTPGPPRSGRSAAERSCSCCSPPAWAACAPPCWRRRRSAARWW